MPGDVTRDEFDQLAARTDVLEREVEGEKLVVRHVLEHTRRNTEDLSVMKSDLAEVKSDVKVLTHRVESLDRKVDGLSREFRDWRGELPGIVGEIVREAIKPLMSKR